MAALVEEGSAVMVAAAGASAVEATMAASVADLAEAPVAVAQVVTGSMR